MDNKTGRKLLRGVSRVAALAAALSMPFTPALAQAAPGNGDLLSQARPAPYPAPPQAPANAPNILVIMTDDTGFGATATFGGPVPTPNMDRLAKAGLRYNNFNTTAMCSPTRAALLTGRNAQSVNYGVISEEASPDAGYNSVIPDSAATFGDVLKLNGYDTAWFGKHHNVPVWEDTPVGPFDHWPDGLGFDYFYGFIGGATSQFAPFLIENRNWVEAPADDPNYILDADMADQAIDWIHIQKSVRPDSPFAIYYAPGSTHSPHQAPKEWIAKFKGQFDQGWDKMREQTFARQKAAGIIPANAKLTPRPAKFPAWSSLSQDERKVASRLMEVYAAQLAFLDFQIGRILDSLEESGELDNTLVVLSIGDNGGSLEGSPEGSMDEIARNKNKIKLSVAEQMTQLDAAGGPFSWNNYNAGWAWAMNTPFQWGKVFASHLGAIRNGLIVSWPDRIKDTGAIRPQFAHVTDIAPTLYDAVGITLPEEFRGVKQMPLEGSSLVGTFDDAKAPSQHREQFFELRENIGFYKDGWLASTQPRVFPWEQEAPPAGGEVKWSLYNLNKDFSQAEDVARRYPDKLAELQKDFVEATEQFNIGKQSRGPDVMPRPSVIGERTHFEYYNTDFRYSRGSFPRVMNRDWKVSADIVVPEQGGDGALIAQGARFAGWGLVILDGKPSFMYNASVLERDQNRVDGDAVLTPGRHMVEADFDYDGGGPGKGGTITLTVDGHVVGTGRMERTPSFMFVGEGGITIGRDYGTTLSDDYTAPFVYPGTINKVTVDLGK
ncbi:arylsulfatase [Croceicoccus bisphenolivorans]|uniref:arylsulfatase n=1 Tax=Croceicoccus bisphenolivorans TaxID=1783232 RepID=UPI00082A1492|nr:arylsulfatase [Croceicoccus bisphenolivorans]